MTTQVDSEPNQPRFALRSLPRSGAPVARPKVVGPADPPPAHRWPPEASAHRGPLGGEVGASRLRDLTPGGENSRCLPQRIRAGSAGHLAHPDVKKLRRIL